MRKFNENIRLLDRLVLEFGDVRMAAKMAEVAQQAQEIDSKLIEWLSLPFLMAMNNTTIGRDIEATHIFDRRLKIDFQEPADVRRYKFKEVAKEVAGQFINDNLLVKAVSCVVEKVDQEIYTFTFCVQAVLFHDKTIGHD